VHLFRLFDSDDFAKGVAALREKRSAVFGSAPLLH
jgi:hypothetical protein